MLKMYGTIILPIVLYLCEAWSLTLRREQRLRVSENRVLRGVFGPERKWQEGGEQCIMRSFINCMKHQMILRLSNQGE
jgi:hypothetical protein